MLITQPEKDQHGYQVSWIKEDHQPGTDEDYDSGLAKYGYEVYSDLEEAKAHLKDHVTRSEVLWGNIREVYFDYIDGLPLKWNDVDTESDHLVYAEEIM